VSGYQDPAILVTVPGIPRAQDADRGPRITKTPGSQRVLDPEDSRIPRVLGLKGPWFPKVSGFREPLDLEELWIPKNSGFQRVPDSLPYFAEVF